MSESGNRADVEHRRADDESESRPQVRFFDVDETDVESASFAFLYPLQLLQYGVWNATDRVFRCSL